jgi:hypothetical protein
MIGSAEMVDDVDTYTRHVYEHPATPNMKRMGSER